MQRTLYLKKGERMSMLKVDIMALHSKRHQLKATRQWCAVTPEGGDVNARSGGYDSALYAASVGGYERVMRLLLEKGADINAQDGKYENSLQAASTKGRKRMAPLLLEKGAHVNDQDEEYGNALQVASAEGHEQLVWL